MKATIDYDVIIIGAGPVGLATALGLYQRGITNLMVFDQTSAFRQVGQGVDLLPNGLKALKYIAPQAYQNILAIGQTFNQPPSNQSPLRWITRNLKGEMIHSVSLAYDEYLDQYGEGRVSISWYELQTQLRLLLPPENLKINHRCVNVITEENDDGIRADFLCDGEREINPYAHWQEDSLNSKQNTETKTKTNPSEYISFRAKLLVAADGIHSKVRQIIYQNTPYSQYQKPEYTGFAAISSGGRNHLPNTLVNELNERFLHNSRVVTLVNHENAGYSIGKEYPRLILFAPEPNEIIYLLHAIIPLELLVNQSGTELINLALLELQKANFPDILQQVVALSSPQQMLQRTYYLHRATVPNLPQPKWNIGRVILAGDAAHGMPPFMAQGANQGLEDAAVINAIISSLIQQNDWNDLNKITSAFTQYEKLRRPLINFVQNTTLTRQPLANEKQWLEYCQLVYGRKLEEMIPDFELINA